jgi:hypothetical protein
LAAVAAVCHLLVVVLVELLKQLHFLRVTKR